MIQPIERGGLGIAPSESKRLTFDEAAFLLMDEKQVRRSDAVIRRRLRERGAKPEPQKQMTAAEYMRQLRLRYTGTEDRDG